MALLRSKLFNRVVANNVLLASRQSSKYPDMPDSEELATGLEKFQMMQIKAGNTDPFKLQAIKRHASSKSNPNLIPSYYDCRIVGCVCEEESCSIVWMWLFKGEPRRCQCGHWFKLVEYRPF